jgi:hypothetical protein
MFEDYRYITGRSLLELSKLDRCQLLTQDTWTSGTKLWHLVFISHRWGGATDPDPSGAQLTSMKLLVRQIANIAGAIADERVGVGAVRDRLARVPSLKRQGSLQAAHLVFRTLCGGAEIAPDDEYRLKDDGILDLIGFWYDFSCLPQDPKTEKEEREFSGTLQGIGEMLLSPRVSTLVLLRAGDGYLERGWCFAESMIAGAKADVFKPMILRTDRWGEPLALNLSGAYVAFQEEIERMLGQWANLASPVAVGAAFESAINATAMLLLLNSDRSMSEFVVAATGTTVAGLGMFAVVQSRIAVLPVGAQLDLAGDLVAAVQEQGLGCRDEQDYILVALLLLKSLTALDATEDLGIWWQALARFTEGLGLVVERQESGLVWQD